MARRNRRKIVKEIGDRLRFLADVGLEYLALDRSAETLSGGEAQRIRLASQIGSGLVGVMYILDEPSIGLHQRDNQRLLATLAHLRDLGNTVIVVEHDEEAILTADHVLDLGPGRRRARRPRSLPRARHRTGHPTSRFAHRPVPVRATRIPLPERTRRAGRRTQLLTIRGAGGNNLQEHRRGHSPWG